MPHQAAIKRVALVGHCGPDMSYLILAVKKALGDVQIDRVNSDAALQQFLQGETGLMLVNRALDGDFAAEGGVDLIATASRANPLVKSILISNYEDAQAAAVQVRALPGFGKRDIGSPAVQQILQSAAAELAG